MNKDFFEVFKGDFKQQLKKSLIIIFSISVIISIWTIQRGINRYKSSMDDVKTFLDIEKTKALTFKGKPKYTQYGSYGIGLISLPPPQSSLIPVPALFIARVDSGSLTNIYNDIKREGIINESRGFTGLFISIILFLSLYFGITVYENEDGKKFLISMTKNISPWAILLSRFTIISIFIFGIMTIATFQLMINEVTLNLGILIILCLIISLTSLAYLTFGVFINVCCRRSKEIIAIVVFFLSLFVIYDQINDVIEYKGESFKLSLKKLKLLMAFENKAEKQVGTFKSGDTANNELKALVESGQKIEYAKMKACEMNLLEGLVKKAKLKHFIFSLSPPTFLTNFVKELSCSGYKGLIDFNQFVHESKGKFTRHYIQKKIYEKQKPGPVEPYSGEQVLQQNFFIPYFALFGIIVVCLYVSLFLILMMYKFKNQYKKFGEMKFESFEFHPKPGCLNYLITKNENLCQFIFHQFLSHSKIAQFEGYFGFIYLTEPILLPAYVEKILKVKNDNSTPRWKVLFNAAIESGMVIIGNRFLEERTNDEINWIKKEVSSKRALFLEIGSNRYHWENADNQLCWKYDVSIDVSQYNGCFDS